MEFHGIVFLAAKCFTGFIFILSVSQAQFATPTPRPCVDAAIINCQIPGLCADAEFASLLCPSTCGHCTNLVPNCTKAESTECATDVCSDLELAVLMCPVTCGFCPDVTTPPPPPSTTTQEPETTTDWPFECPYCVDAIHTDDCLKTTQTCAKNHVCKGTVDDWKLTVMCASPLICEFEELQGNRNCSSGNAFGPHEHCTFCCQGDECTQDLEHAQQGLDNIPLVLHCPTCQNESSPSACAHRVVPCSPDQDVCEITNNFGVFDAHCAKSSECSSAETSSTCRPDRGSCTSCCQTTECITNSLTMLVSTRTYYINTLTEAPNICKDADFYPCAFAANVACGDPDMSVTVCPVTCGKCEDWGLQQQL